VLAVLARPDLWLEPRLSKEPEPVRPGEETLDMAVMLDRDCAVLVTQQIRDVDPVGLVGGIGIRGPFEVPEGSPFAVAAA